MNFFKGITSKGSLLSAAEKGDLDTVKAIVQSQPDLVNAKSYYGNAPLHNAAANGRKEVVEWLVTHGGATVEITDSNQNKTPLIRAANNGHTRVVEWLVDHGNANLEATDDNLWTALHFACIKGYTDLVEWLVMHANANVNAVTKNGKTPLHLACQAGQVAILECLVLDGEAAVDAATHDGEQPLHTACHAGQMAAVEWLVLQGNAPIEALTHADNTPLHTACASNRPESLAVVEWLVTTGDANVNAVNKVGYQPIHEAVAKGHKTVVEWLMRREDRSSSCMVPHNRNDPEWKIRIQQKQQRLLLLHHSAKCPHEEGHCNAIPQCTDTKQLLRHMEGCKDNNCPVSDCFSSRAIMSHYRKCKDTNCPACGPIRDTVNKSSQNRTPSAEWKIRMQQKQQRLLLLHHSAKCPHEDGRCNVTPYCADTKRLWSHIEGCKDKNCGVSNCFPSRAILTHYSKCKDTNCPACGPVRDTVKKSSQNRKPAYP